MNNQKLAIDIGYGWTKFYDGKTLKKIPSIFTRKSGNYFDDSSVISHDNDYIVGKPASIFPFSSLSYEDVSDIIKYAPLFVKYAIKTTKSTPDTIISGLPPGFKSKFPEFKSVLQQFANNVIIVPQSVGILSYVLEKNMSLIDKKILTIDIGFNTLDYIINYYNKEKKEWVFESYDTFVNFGTSKCLETFRSTCPMEIVGQYTINELQEIFENGYIGNPKIDLSEYKKNAIELYSEHVINTIKNVISKKIFNIIDVIIIGGGGANIIDTSKFDKEIIIPEQPDFAQVIGYYSLI
ncbi:MAG: ParM/StbA family protein [Minisyncoccia bacterium]|jgi:hypothetical protein